MNYLNKNINKINAYPFDNLRSLLSDSKKKNDVIDLSIGQPMHDTPEFVSKIIFEEKNKWKLYPPLAGIKSLREAYIEWLQKRFSVNKFFNENNIMPLSGTREGLFSIAMALNVKKVCIPNPFYQVYLGASVHSRLNKVFLTTNNLNNYLISLKKLKTILKEGPCLVYFCSPSNPQGKIADYNYIEELIKIVRFYNSVLVIDECYTDIYYQKKPVGTIEICESLGSSLSNVLIFHSLSKRSNVAGLRSGFVVGDSSIINHFKKLRSYSAPTIPIPIQIASRELWKDEKHVELNRIKYKKKLLYADKVFNDFNFYESPEAGFFLWLKVGNGESFTRKVYEKYSIKIMPGKYLASGSKINPGEEFVRVALVHNYKKNNDALKKISMLLS